MIKVTESNAYKLLRSVVLTAPTIVACEKRFNLVVEINSFIYLNSKALLRQAYRN